MADKKSQKASIVDRPLSKGRGEINISTFALLFSEMVQYCQNRVSTVPELQSKLSELGYHVGIRMLDLIFIREKGLRRETKLLNILLFIKSNVWKALFGKEADKLEHANDEERTCILLQFLVS
ncbi:putative trafficking protein particle complex subunit 5 [Apostichopus japonicus]|uniref:Putative trafficking protein particle complex subunit 5 n=1 Tax=Stichopus japonicus TaxID=307972 RepID=A0A2G8K3D7_STIJA|nr:putative trafficking protein particle complex subunit 5 [Apostichopus japonicus]